MALAAVLRVGIAVGSWARQPVDDERSYDTLARSIVAGRGFTSDRSLGFVHPGGGAATSLWGCLQPLYLAGIYRLFGAAPGSSYLTNAVVGLTTVVFTMALARLVSARLPGGAPRAPVVAGLLVAGNVYLLKLTATLLTETLYVALLVAALWGLASWQESVAGRVRWAGLSGLLLGLASLTRAQAFYLVPIVLVWLWLEGRGERAISRLEVGTFVVALGCVLAPWVARNLRVHDRPVFLDTKAGWNLYGYFHPDFDPLLGNWVAVPPEVLTAATSESRRNEILKQHAWRFAVENPARLIWMAPRKLWLLWSPFAGEQTDPRLAPIKLAYVLPLEILALVGLARTRAATPSLRLLLVLIGFYVVVHSVMTGGPRFRVPLDPALAIFAGCALSPRGQSRMSSSTPA